jgi:hypothetical protein
MTEDRDTGGEPLPAADHLAVEIRRRRRAADLSQRELARLCGYTREYISMAERHGTNIPSRELVRALDSALDAGGTLVTLRSHAADEQRARRARHHGFADTASADPNLLDGVRRAVLGAPGEPLPDIDIAITRAHTHYQQADYDDAVRLLPRIISGLTASPARAKALAYLAAAKLATKVGDAGLAWVTADRCTAFAVESGNPELIGIARYQVAAALLAGGHDPDAEQAAGEALDDLPVGDDVRGSLLLLLAITAARGGQRSLATQRLRAAAERAREDRNHLWTAFGPTNVAVHELGVHVAIGDTRTAMLLGERIGTNGLPAQLKGRRAQIHLELAAAATGQHADHLAVLHLLEAERVARQAVARNATTRRLVGELLARERNTPGLRALAVRAGVAA